VPDHAKRLREMAESKLYRPSHRFNQQLLETIQALRAGANAIEWMDRFQRETVEFHGGVRKAAKDA
jgi:TnpA family transposase